MTFSHDALANVRELMDDFFLISNSQIFTLENPRDSQAELFDPLPHWFSRFGSRSIASWIVSHFAVNILKLLIN